MWMAATLERVFVPFMCEPGGALLALVKFAPGLAVVAQPGDCDDTSERQHDQHADANVKQIVVHGLLFIMCRTTIAMMTKSMQIQIFANKISI